MGVSGAAPPPTVPGWIGHLPRPRAGHPTPPRLGLGPPNGLPIPAWWWPQRDSRGTSVLKKGSLERKKEHISTPPDSENGFLPGKQTQSTLPSRRESEPGKQWGCWGEGRKALARAGSWEQDEELERAGCRPCRPAIPGSGPGQATCPLASVCLPDQWAPLPASRGTL